MYQKYFIGCPYNHQKYALAQNYTCGDRKYIHDEYLGCDTSWITENVLFISDIQLKIPPNLLA